jgi:hypothetical protein
VNKTNKTNQTKQTSEPANEPANSRTASGS